LWWAWRLNPSISRIPISNPSFAHKLQPLQKYARLKETQNCLVIEKGVVNYVSLGKNFLCQLSSKINMENMANKPEPAAQYPKMDSSTR